MTNAPSGAGDRYYVYRPVLDLIGKSVGTDKGRVYNETLGYGILLDSKVTKGKGPTIDLVSMTLDQVACYLLGQRGIDKWLSGRLSLDTLIGNLAQEWASIPKPDGKGHYADQNAGVSVSQVKTALAEVARRHAEGQPKIEIKVPVEVEKPVVPVEVEKAVTKQTSGWGWSGLGLGGVGAALTAIAGWPWQTIALFAGLAVAGGLLALVIGPWIVRRVKAIRAEATA